MVITIFFLELFNERRQKALSILGFYLQLKLFENRAPTTFKLEGEVTSLSESSQGEVGDNREKWGDFWVQNLIAINRNIVS